MPVYFQLDKLNKPTSVHHAEDYIKFAKNVNSFLIFKIPIRLILAKICAKSEGYTPGRNKHEQEKLDKHLKICKNCVYTKWLTSQRRDHVFNINFSI